MKRRSMETSNTSSWVLWAMPERDGSLTGRQTHSSELMTSHSLLRNNIIGMKWIKLQLVCFFCFISMNFFFLQLSVQFIRVCLHITKINVALWQHRPTAPFFNIYVKFYALHWTSGLCVCVCIWPSILAGWYAVHDCISIIIDWIYLHDCMLILYKFWASGVNWWCAQFIQCSFQACSFCGLQYR